jgi:hypothetical protein
MKSLTLNKFRQFIYQEGIRLTGQRLVKDRLSLGLLIAAAATNVVTILLLLANLTPTDFPVPVRYSSLLGFQALGPWYQIYYIALFGVGVTLINSILAAMAYTRSRITSFFLLVGAFVVSLFCLIISLAFAAIV